MIKGFEHTGIKVTNMEKSISFYGELLGMELINRFKHPAGEVELAFLGMDNTVLIELVAGPFENLPEEGKVSHAAFTVTDIEEKFQVLQEKGIPIKDKEITELPNGKYFFFFGPDGESLEFFERK
jgi:lactoylglutathione lyase